MGSLPASSSSSLPIHSQNQQDDESSRELKRHTTSIRNCGRVSKWANALMLLNKMPRKHLEPNVYTYNATISAMQKGQQPEKALQLLEQMTRNSIEPNTVSYCTSIATCEEHQLTEQAQSLREE